MNGIWEIATKIYTPLMLAGLVIIAMFFIFRLMLSRGFIPRVDRSTGGKILLTIIWVFFGLALLAIILGFAGYVVDKYYPDLSAGYVNVATDQDKSFEVMVKATAKGRNVTINFNQNCNESVKKAIVEAGDHEGSNIKSFLENLKQRIKGESINYTVIEEGERRYEIICS